MNMEHALFLDDINLKSAHSHRNLSVAKLVDEAIKNGEGTLSSTGAICLYTGQYTGRSPRDKFIVESSGVNSTINWGKINQPISEDIFDSIYSELNDYLNKKEIYIFEGNVGSDIDYSLKVRFINETAIQNLFVHQLFIRLSKEDIKKFKPDFTVITAPGYKPSPAIKCLNSEAFIIINFEKKIIMIGGTGYCGEIKKAVFSVMNYILPEKGILPMHCSANRGRAGDTALFFGLSGTGKTTLSADEERQLIGDDEHGWSSKGIFNFEGGCYAKCIGLSMEKEPQIWNAIKFGTILENVILDDEGNEKFEDSALTENTRAGYPIENIPGAIDNGLGDIPSTILFLTADAFGVLPPVARLTKEQAMYHFLSGYTSKLGGTERGIKIPEATFSSCFGAPFMPRNPIVYAKMLGEKIEKNNVKVYLVNTGWAGGSYGVGKRINLQYTRAIVREAINGTINDEDYEIHPIFKLKIPKYCEGVPAELLNPINNWKDKELYVRTSQKLAEQFSENFRQFSDIPEEIKEAGPDWNLDCNMLYKI